MSYSVTVKGANYLNDARIWLASFDSKETADNQIELAEKNISDYRNRMHKMKKHPILAIIREVAISFMSEKWSYWLGHVVPEDEREVYVMIDNLKYQNHSYSTFAEERKSAFDDANVLFRKVRFITKAMKNSNSVEKFNQFFYEYEDALDSYFEKILTIVKCDIAIKYIDTLEQG